MIKKCPECRKENSAEINVCPCGFRFMNPGDIIKEFSPPKRNSLNISGILTFGVFLIVGLTAVAFFIGMPGFLVQTISRSEEKVSLVDENLPVSAPSEKNVLPLPLRTQSLIGKVTSVKSGDLITVFDELTGRDYEIKLAGIKAPELNQKFGQKAQDNLSTLILEKEVFVLFKNSDESNVQFGKVLLADKDINLEQIKAGLAEYDEITTNVFSDIESDLYAKAEATAKASEIGRWAAVNPIKQKTTDLQNNGENSAENQGVYENDKAVSEKRQETKPSAETKNQNETRSEQSGNNRSKTENVSAKEQTVKNKPVEKSLGTPTARCQDGTFSYSKSDSGACSYHGGVAERLGDEKKSSSSKKAESNERKYIRGPRGGCYYVTGSGGKIYVDRSLCN